MRFSSTRFLVGLSALIITTPAFASPGATPLSQQSGQAVQSPVNSSRPLIGNANSQAEAAGESTVAASIAAAVLPAAEQDWDNVLGRYVAPPDETGLARFDYAGLKASKKDHKILTDYIAHLEAKDPDEMTDNEAIAYWANLYNAVTVKLIVDHYPVKSIRKIKSGLISIGPWGKKLVTVNGERLTLDNIEHDILRKQYPSALIHYMVNCASVGCPNLKAGVWRAETLDADRETAAREFINSPRGAELGEKGLTVSSIYSWFKEDFGGNKDGVLAHLREYAEPELAGAIDEGVKIRDFDYDWALNGGSDNE